MLLVQNTILGHEKMKTTYDKFDSTMWKTRLPRHGVPLCCFKTDRLLLRSVDASLLLVVKHLYYFDTQFLHLTRNNVRANIIEMPRQESTLFIVGRAQYLADSAAPGVFYLTPEVSTSPILSLRFGLFPVRLVLLHFIPARFN